MEDVICLKLGDFEENCYIFSYGDKLCVVDPGECSSALVRQIEILCEKDNLVFASVFLTHGHLDHVAGLQKLKPLFPNIKIYINERDKACLGKGSYKFQYDDFSKAGLSHFVNKSLSSPTDLPEADFLVKNGSILFGDWQVIATPGHTQGSSCLYNAQRKLLFTGDTLMFYSYGRTDMFGGSDQDMEKSLQLLKQLPKGTIVCPGHENFGFELEKSFVWSLS